MVFSAVTRSLWQHPGFVPLITFPMISSTVLVLRPTPVSVVCLVDMSEPIDCYAWCLIKGKKAPV